MGIAGANWHDAALFLFFGCNVGLDVSSPNFTRVPGDLAKFGGCVLVVQRLAAVKPECLRSTVYHINSVLGDLIIGPNGKTFIISFFNFLRLCLLMFYNLATWQ